jgi:hypothetical protein
MTLYFKISRYLSCNLYKNVGYLKCSEQEDSLSEISKKKVSLLYLLYKFLIMKTKISTVLFFIALFASIQIQAQQKLIVANPLNCPYTIKAFIAPTGTCPSSPTSTISFTVPALFNGVIGTTNSGDWFVGVQFAPGINLSDCSNFSNIGYYTNLCGQVINGFFYHNSLDGVLEISQ